MFDVAAGTSGGRSRRARRLAPALVVVLATLVAPAVASGQGITAHGQRPAASGTAAAVAVGVDLSTSISSSPALPVPDGTADIFVTVVNGGTEDATNVSLTVSIPTGTHVQSILGNGCVMGATSVTCTGGTVTSGGWWPILISLDQLVVGTHHFSSSASADQPDVDNASSADHDLVVVPEEADLVGISRTDRVKVGSTYRVDHIFTNNGPTAAAEASLAGTFPVAGQLVPGSFVFGTGSDDLTASRCDVSATGFACQPLSTNASLSTDYLQDFVHYDIILPDAPQTLEASATITGRNDPDPTNNTSTLTIEVEPDLAELSAGFELLRPTAAAGQTFNAFGRVENVGQQTASDVVVTFSASLGWTVSLWPGFQPACAVGDPGLTVVCRYEPLEFGGVVFPVVELTAPTGGGSLGSVTIDVETTTPESGTSPNTATANVQVLPLGADLVADPGLASPTSTRVDQPIALTWRFRNDSADRVAESASFSTDLPAGVTLREIQAQTTQGQALACTIDPATHQGQCQVTGEGYLWPGLEVEVTAVVTAEVGGSHQLTATANQTSTEAAPGDESSTVAVEVAPAEADLLVAVFPSETEVSVGETNSYVVAVANAGPDAGTNVSLDADATAGVEVLSAKVGWFGVPCPVTGGAIHCPIRSASTFVVVTARPLVAGVAMTSFTVSGARADPDPASNAASVTVTAVPPEQASPVDLAVSIPDPPGGPFTVGQTFTAVVAIDNRSLRSSTGVVVNGTGDGSGRLQVVSAAIGWFGRPCAIGADVTCSIGEVSAHGGTFVVVTLRPVAPGAFDTTFSLTGDQPDPDATSNTAHLTGSAAAP